jgi:hypothetical protein
MLKALLVTLPFVSSLTFAQQMPREFISKEHKIHHVTTYSDRALVSRRLSFEPVGSQWIKISQLPRNIDKKSLRLRLVNGNSRAIEQILIGESFYKNTLPEDVDKKLKALRNLYLKRLNLEQRLYLKNIEISFLGGLNFNIPFANNSNHFQSYVASTGKVDSSINAIGAERIQLHTEVSGLQQAIENTNRDIAVIQTELGENQGRTSQQWLTDVFVKFNNKLLKKNNTLEIDYMLPNAYWHPSYDIRCNLDLKNGTAQINLVTMGIIQNKTGETWDEVNVTLSSIDPAPLFLPRLNRWLFSEKREEEIVPESEGFFGGIASEAPKMQAKSAPRSARVKRKKSRARMQKKEMVMEEMDIAMSNESPMALAPSNMPMPGKQVRGRKNLYTGKPSGDIASNLFTKNQLTSIYHEYRDQLSYVERLRDDRPQFNIWKQSPIRQAKKNRYNDSSLPAVMANGRKIEFTSPFSINLNSHDEPLRIPVNTSGLTGSLEYLAIPKVDNKVYLRSIVKNSTGLPILGGKANIFMDGDLTSKTSIGTTNEGSTMTLNLGTDEAVMTKRIVKKKSKDSGMIFKKHQMKVEVILEVVNNHSFPIQLKLKDNYPKTPNKDIEVELGKITPKPTTKKYGIIEWNQSIAANKKQTFKFEYEVTHPEKFIVKEYDQ